MKEMQGKELVRRIGKHLGICVQDIPRKQSKTPDFELIIQDEISLVEFKLRDGTWTLSDEEQAVLDSGDVLVQSEATGYHNRISGIVRYGCKQLREYESKRHRFRLIWFHTFGQFAELSRNRVKATLTGCQNVFEIWSPNKHQWMAYYFDYSEFFSQSDILDGAFLTCCDNDGELVAELCLNTWSSRYKALRSSSLCAAFAPGVCDPFVLEQRGTVLLVDGNVARSDPHAVLQHLSAKYGLKQLWYARMQQHVFSVQPAVKSSGPT